MAVSIPSDIVLEVAQSRRPDRYARVIERLSKGVSGETTTAKASEFSSMAAQTPFQMINHLPGTATANMSSGSESASAFRKLEAQVVKQLIETMMPASIAGGKPNSTANGFWKSTLADTLAQRISERGQIGLATRLQAAFELRNSNTIKPDASSAS